jgi:hypothetical protein
MQPETQYAKSGPVNIAYQVPGDGPPDIVAAEVISHIELDWESRSRASPSSCPSSASRCA